MAPQRPFDDIIFAENPEPRCPCVLLLDTSASMSGQPIQELNLGLSAYFDELLADPVAANVPWIYAGSKPRAFQPGPSRRAQKAVTSIAPASAAAGYRHAAAALFVQRGAACWPSATP